MTNELAIKILGYMKEHEEKNLIIFGDKKDNAEALQFGINALKFELETRIPCKDN